MSNQSIENNLDDELSQDMLSCLELGNCGFKELSDGSLAVDLAFDLDAKEVKMSRDPETNDLIIHKARILSPGKRNLFDYPLESVKLTRYLKKGLELSAMPTPFVVPHTSNPVEQIGRVDNLEWDDDETSIVGDPRIYDDPRLPLAEAAIAILEREKGFMSLSTRLKVEPFSNESASEKQSVRNLRLIHVAWVDVGADPTAGKDLSNADNADETVDNPFPNEHACRLRDPGDFQPDSFRRLPPRNHEGKKYVPIAGRLKGETAVTEQTYRYPIDTWTAAAAKSHCESHDGKTFEAAKTQSSNDPLDNAESASQAPTETSPSDSGVNVGSSSVTHPNQPNVGTLSTLLTAVDTSGPDESADVSQKEQNFENSRGFKMSEIEEAPTGTVGTEVPTEDPEDPKEPITQNEQNVPETHQPTALADMADDQEVTLKAGELRQLKADLYKQFVEESERQVLIEEITALGAEIPTELYGSLHSNEQLKMLKQIIDRLISKISERDNSIAMLEQKQFHLTGEKPSMSASLQGPDEAAELAAKKFYGTPEMERYPKRAEMMGKVLARSEQR